MDASLWLGFASGSHASLLDPASGVSSHSLVGVVLVGLLKDWHISWRVVVVIHPWGVVDALLMLLMLLLLLMLLHLCSLVYVINIDPSMILVVLWSIIFWHFIIVLLPVILHFLVVSVELILVREHVAILWHLSTNFDRRDNLVDSMIGQSSSCAS